MEKKVQCILIIVFYDELIIFSDHFHAFPDYPIEDFVM
jgi:hypothetical protein